MYVNRSKLNLASQIKFLLNLRVIKSTLCYSNQNDECDERHHWNVKVWGLNIASRSWLVDFRLIAILGLLRLPVIIF